VTAIGQAVGTRVRRRAERWARTRQGSDPHSVSLHTRRIYILPTRVGIIFAAIVFTMLLGSMNYNNNLGFVLTFLLTGIAVVSIYHCHRNLTELCLHYLGAEPVFAGDEIGFRFAFENSRRRSRWQIRVDWDGHQQLCDELKPESRVTLCLRLATVQRGMINAPRIQISTRFPLGLFRAWAWINMDRAELVYPRPAKHASANLSGDAGQNASRHNAGGDDDFSGLREYRLGDSPKHIAWKTFARIGETLVTEFLSGSQDPLWIDWKDCPETDPELRIARLTRQVIDAHNANNKFGLRIPGHEIPPAHGSQHRHQCLKQLALYGARVERPVRTA
jgi:uncharacterized protein (DUF58 family)